MAVSDFTLPWMTNHCFAVFFGSRDIRLLYINVRVRRRRHPVAFNITRNNVLIISERKVPHFLTVSLFSSVAVP